MRFAPFILVIGMAGVLLSPDCHAQETAASQTRAASTADCGMLAEAAEALRLARGGTEGEAAARIQLKALIDKNGGSENLAVLIALLDNLNEKGAGHMLGVAMFYRSREHSDRAVEGRLNEILRRYPAYSRTDEVLFQLAEVQIKSERNAEARETLGKLVNQFGLAPRARDARALLEKMGK